MKISKKIHHCREVLVWYGDATFNLTKSLNASPWNLGLSLRFSRSIIQSSDVALFQDTTKHLAYSPSPRHMLMTISSDPDASSSPSFPWWNLGSQLITARSSSKVPIHLLFIEGAIADLQTATKAYVSSCGCLSRELPEDQFGSQAYFVMESVAISSAFILSPTALCSIYFFYEVGLLSYFEQNSTSFRLVTRFGSNLWSLFVVASFSLEYMRTIKLKRLAMSRQWICKSLNHSICMVHPCLFSGHCSSSTMIFLSKYQWFSFNDVFLLYRTCLSSNLVVVTLLLGLSQGIPHLPYIEVYTSFGLILSNSKGLIPYVSFWFLFCYRCNVKCYAKLRLGPFLS